MAARLRTYQQDEVRAKIQTTQLINRLTGIATGEITGDGLSVQVTAALGLLKKVLPDLASTELSSPDGEALQVTHIQLTGPTSFGTDTA